MKKKLISTSVALMLSAAACSAFAAEDANLTVTGTIVPPVCGIELSDAGVVDYGQIAADVISSTAPTALEEKNITLTMTCDADAPIAYTIVDNNAGSVAEMEGFEQNFGLGKTAEDVSIGAFNIVPGAATYTTEASEAATEAALIAAPKDTTDWAEFAGQLVVDNELSMAKSGDTAPVAVKTATIPLAVTAVVQDRTTLNTREDIVLDGSATITLKYL